MSVGANLHAHVCALSFRGGSGVRDQSSSMVLKPWTRKSVDENEKEACIR